MQTSDPSHSLNEAINLPTVKQTSDRHISQRLSAILAILIIITVVGLSFLMFQSNVSSGGDSSTLPTNISPVGAVGTPVSAHGQMSGLEVSMHVTPGPYFLSELLAIDLALTNHTNGIVTLAGSREVGTCGSAFYAPPSCDLLSYLSICIYKRMKSFFLCEKP